MFPFAFCLLLISSLPAPFFASRTFLEQKVKLSRLWTSLPQIDWFGLRSCSDYAGVSWYDIMFALPTGVDVLCHPCQRGFSWHQSHQFFFCSVSRWSCFPVVVEQFAWNAEIQHFLHLMLLDRTGMAANGLSPMLRPSALCRHFPLCQTTGTTFNKNTKL